MPGRRARPCGLSRPSGVRSAGAICPVGNTKTLLGHTPLPVSVTAEPHGSFLNRETKGRTLCSDLSEKGYMRNRCALPFCQLERK